MLFKFTINRRRLLIAFLLSVVGLVSIAFYVFRHQEILYEGRSLEHWIEEAEDTANTERHVAIATLLDILESISKSGPTANFPFVLGVYFERSKIEKSRAHVRANLSRITGILERELSSQEAITRKSAVRGLATIGLWSGPDGLRLVLPVIIRGCHDEDEQVQIDSRRCLIASLSCFREYETLPNKDLFPIVMKALDDDHSQYHAVAILRNMGEFAGESAIPRLEEIVKSKGGKLNRNLRAQTKWALGRIRGDK